MAGKIAIKIQRDNFFETNTFFEIYIRWSVNNIILFI